MNTVLPTTIPAYLAQLRKSLEGADAAMIHDARRAVFLEAGLAFLGISDPLAQSWGKMIQQALAFTYLDAWSWWLLPPGVAVSSLVLAFALIGAGLEEPHAAD